ncbi:MAG: hypothetical protein CVV59_00640 [Tenericutes bacterium HGW-Tenericutes-4]|nr:MAG: hypothetical protein CVV59_00640 [Tenericutes bacterium HGW-Tenericutes-4]
MFIMLIGSSGVGKNTLINELRNNYEKEVVLMPTLTTRSMRPGEKEGDPFYFLTKEQFEEKIKNNELFEYENMHGKYVGSSRTIFNDYIKKGAILMKDIGVEGATNLAPLLKEHTNVIRVFLETKNKRVLVRRLKGRGEKEIKKRLKRYNYEQTYKYKFDYIILNKTKEQTVNLLKDIIVSENKLENVLFTKPLHKLNHKKVNKLVEKYKLGASEDAVKVCLQNGKIILQNKEEQFVASVISNSILTKKIVEKSGKLPLGEIEQEHWRVYLKTIKQ